MGMAPMAFSMSSSRQLFGPVMRTLGGFTSQAAEAELLELVDLVRELAVVLDDVDVIGRREQTSEARGVRVP